MVERRLAQIAEHLHSIDDFRRRALTAGDEQRAARAEQVIIQLEQQVADLTGQLQQREEPAPAEPAEPTERERTQRQHIFVVNGDPDFLNIVRALLQDERYNVTTTNFVARTFDQVAALQPALLVVDLVVGERVGWDLLDQLQEAAGTHDIPVIVTSTDPRLLDRARANQQRYGGQRFVDKPLDLDALLATIEELIGEA